MRPLSAVLAIALAAFCSAVSTASADAPPAPVLVHSDAERDLASSVAGSGVPGTSAVGPADAVYARRADGWIQYWIWFEDNRQDRGTLRSGPHAGDWELVQYRDDGSEAVYAQHAGAERCGRRDIEFRGERPVVYVANGSHAAYFHGGVRDRMWPDPNDEADGRGAIQRPIAVSGERGRAAVDALPRPLGRRPRRVVPARAVLATRARVPGRALGRPRGLRPRGPAVHRAALRGHRSLRRSRERRRRRARRRAARAGWPRVVGTAPAPADVNCAG
jgi:hypothetical protein